MIQIISYDILQNNRRIKKVPFEKVLQQKSEIPIFRKSMISEVKKEYPANNIYITFDYIEI